MEHLVKIVLIVALFILIPRWIWGQETKVKIALLKYKGGGDWYANPTALPNLIKFCNENLGTDLAKEPATVEPGSRDIFNYPFVHMTGHGNIVFTPVEVQNMREYLLAGGFLHADDNYGLDKAFRREMKKVFPEDDFIELPWDHPIFSQKYKFPEGLPKVHEHDNKRPQAFGIVKDGRLLVLYTYETDLGDGWEDQEVHKDPEDKRLQALQMGANIISYVFLNQ
ncbi:MULTISPECIES: DUF4159 domain-containing protein [Culturomica]|jgi:hypothetical protein|uniref:DUF4159 domain-containing protein n=1 Tax=Culturomica TaxID=1926651 RepID=UPI0008385F4A|nr:MULTISPECIES: DUF4159 domain-containing protein [Odoribacteraceae]RHV97694.1 DUF4159 domain-containing protein [Odoribacter sp. OF09-27XD]HBO27447.1 DUF4159 domain-containing protein [Culturomica sp.]